MPTDPETQEVSRDQVPFHIRVSCIRALEESIETRLRDRVARSYDARVTAHMIDAYEWMTGNRTKAQFYRACLSALWPEHAA